MYYHEITKQKEEAAVTQTPNIQTCQLKLNISITAELTTD